MHHNAMAACDRHLAKGTRHVLGADTTKEVRVSRVRNDPMYVCYCGIPATFFFLAVEKSRESGQPRTEKIGDFSDHNVAAFPRKKNEW